MPRLIDANALLADFMETYNKDRIEMENCYPWWCFDKAIKNAPTVDAVEVVHGQWKKVTDEDEIVWEMDFYQCSVCGKLRWFETNYCPNCGADMRERKANE